MINGRGKSGKSGRQGDGCARRRLAQESVFAVDICDGCNTFQLHLGALSLRLPEDAVVELQSTLQKALAEHARRQSDIDDFVGPLSFAQSSRGEA